jgi:putative ABC transport system ATP-binding protein
VRLSDQLAARRRERDIIDRGMVKVGDGVTGGVLIQARGLAKTYRRATEEIHVLRGLDLDIAAGEFVAFMGPSGSGKTTLLNLLGGLDTPSAGTVSVGDKAITSMARRELAAWRARNVGFVFQLYNLLPVLTAFQNVELPLLLTSLSRASRRQRVETALRIVGLQDRMHHYPRQLSGGQEQRVAIARAIVTSPAVLLCDEPTGDLDRASGDAVLDLLSVLVSEHKTTVLMVTHDPHAAERASALLHLEKGVLMEAIERPVRQEAGA